LFRRQVKRGCFHSLTIPKAPRICKESREKDGPSLNLVLLETITKWVWFPKTRRT
jgi:hypothetical protein